MSILTFLLASIYYFCLPSEKTATEKQTFATSIQLDTISPKTKGAKLLKVDETFQTSLLNYTQQVQREKVYLHVDRTLYKTNEDVWFSMYLCDAYSLLPSPLSQILYVDLIAPNGNVQEKKTYLLLNGNAKGDFQLHSDLKGGIYKIRAYTNWMKNTEAFFEKEITIQAVVLPNLRMKLEFERKAYSSGDEVEAKFDANTLDNKPLSNQEVSFTASIVGDKTIQGKAKTDEKGHCVLTFRLPENLSSNDGLLNVTLPYDGQVEAISRAIPIVLNKIDLQFLPEGGQLVAGLPTRMAFKALNEFGKPADIEGVVKNSKGKVVSTFKSFHDGMGAFPFLAEAGENYSAKITKPEGINTAFAITVNAEKGTVLNLFPQKDNIKTLLYSNDAECLSGYLVAQMNSKVLFQKEISLKKGEPTEVDIPIADWSIGVASVTFFDKKRNPLNERLAFVNRHKSLNINIKTDKEKYIPREKVAMNIKVSDHEGKPVKGTFSLSVADDQQLAFADDKQGHILSSLCLESELKGKIEEPNYYFDTKESKSLEALDFLMLTQGWRCFQWKEIMADRLDFTSSYAFKHEKTIITARFLNKKTQKPLIGYAFYTSPRSKNFFTNENGEVSFFEEDIKNQTYFVFGRQPIYIDKAVDFTLYVDNNNVYDAFGNVVNYISTPIPSLGAAGLIVGTLNDIDKNPISKAEILVYQEKRLKYRAFTDVTGHYSINLPIGKYDIFYKLKKHNEVMISSVDLHGGQMIDVSDYFKNTHEISYSNTNYGGSQGTIRGTLTDKTGETIIGANVIVFKGGVKKAGAVTDIDGRYSINLDAGMYDVEFRYIGLATYKITQVVLPPGQIVKLSAKMDEELSDVLSEVVVKEYKVPLIRQDNTTSGGNLTTEQITMAPTRNVSALVVLTPAVSSNEGDENIRIKGSRDGNTIYMVDGIRVNKDVLPPAQEIEQFDDVSSGVEARFGSFEEAFGTSALNARAVDISIPSYKKQKDTYFEKSKKAEYNSSYNNQHTRSFSYARVFYAPQYTAKRESVTRNDFRTTIYWNPTITTNDKGEAALEFYNSDAVSTFRATLEGIGNQCIVGRQEYFYATQLPMSLSSKAPDKVLTGDIVKIPLTLKNNTDEPLQGKLIVTVPSNFEAVDHIPSEVNLEKNSAKSLFLTYKVANQSTFSLGDEQKFVIRFETKDWNDEFVTQIKTLSRGFPVTQVYNGNNLSNDFDMTLLHPVEKTANMTLTAYPSSLDDILGSMERMFRQPSGCFEQVSSSNYPNLLVLDLLQSTKIANRDVEKRALDYLADGYKQLTAYECKSGGFDWWGRDPAHEGLTAYGILEFTDMNKVFNVDKKMIDRTVKWLLSRRNGNGGWTLNPNALHGWQNDDVLDVYICYALAEAGYGKEVLKEINKLYPSVLAQKDAYSQALLANALFSMNDNTRANALINNILKVKNADGSFTGKTHSVFHSYGNGLAIETTSLVALALMKAEKNGLELSKAINYIAMSKSEYGYGNTQSTVMALKALCAYTRFQKVEKSDGNLVVMINDKKITTRKYSKDQFGRIVIDDLGRYLNQETNKVKVYFEETKQAIPFDITLKYASRLPNNSLESPLRFSTVLSQKNAKMGDVVRLSAILENKSAKAVASPIMVLGIPAGLTAQTWQLKQIVERKECAFYEIFNNYIVFYFDELASNSSQTIHLDLRSDIGGTYEAPASAAYPYYTNEWRVWSKPEAITIE